LKDVAVVERLDTLSVSVMYLLTLPMLLGISRFTTGSMGKCIKRTIDKRWKSDGPWLVSRVDSVDNRVINSLEVDKVQT